ncbi:uncharacterized protein ASCRUDRAFT_8753 [Ascoidea rubescens DSM 1968]|uniref:Uncharacterized protein n=1 Tax=Ascoidea rubescens DSM 1968 TaxID=1344418 RepID=A0A1D2VG40_9ASCO|nr:hypothetical protein ASCRUDRAFT_8753 [Ascoidea rubescens DSM 1968]ODV60552.1 hypothetical protein ASCRUDRAFT_8753 [Ascoidea rubescens DSM 1968]
MGVIFKIIGVILTVSEFDTFNGNNDQLAIDLPFQWMDIGNLAAAQKHEMHSNSSFGGEPLEEFKVLLETSKSHARVISWKSPFRSKWHSKLRNREGSQEVNQ